MRVIITNHVAHAPSIICLISNAEYKDSTGFCQKCGIMMLKLTLNACQRKNALGFNQVFFFIIVILVGLWCHLLHVQFSNNEFWFLTEIGGVEGGSARSDSPGPALQGPLQVEVEQPPDPELEKSLLGYLSELSLSLPIDSLAITNQLNTVRSVCMLVYTLPVTNLDMYSLLLSPTLDKK